MLDALLDNADRAGLARLARMLRIHARAEEDIVFPALDGSHELGHHVREDQALHRVIDAELLAVEREPDDAAWQPRLAALRVTLVAHCAEEESQLFPRARCVISDSHARDLFDVYELEQEMLAHVR